MNNVIKSIIRRFFGTQIIKVHYLGKKIVPTKTDVDDLVRELKYDDFLLGDKEEFTTAKLEVIKKRYGDESYKAFGIIENNKLIYSCWISLKILGLPVILKDKIILGPEQGYLEDAYCSLQTRGRGFHTKMISYRLSRLYDNGKKYGVITVLNGNIPALKANIKSGMKDLGVFYCGKFFWRPFCTLSGKKKAHFDAQILNQ